MDEGREDGEGKKIQNPWSKYYYSSIHGVLDFGVAIYWALKDNIFLIQALRGIREAVMDWLYIHSLET